MKTLVDYRKMDLKALKQELSTVRAQVLSLRFQIASGDSNNYQKLRTWKKTIAQLLTLLKTRKTVA